MSSRFRPREEPGLFDDLPLHQDPTPGRKTESVTATAPEPKPRTPAQEPPESLSLFSEEDEVAAIDPVTRPAWRPIVPFNARLTAGVIDLMSVLVVMLGVWAGLWAMGVEMDLAGRGIVLLFLLPFSFLYQIFPLAFWGCTPGMARVGIVSRSRDGQNLSFSQAALRWLGSVLTVATAGLPLILTATTGRSLADRLSGSQTLPAR